MKRIIFFIVSASLFLACNQASEKTTETKSEPESNNISYPYKPNYSTDFKMGDANHSKLVLDFFRKWEENKVDEMRAMLTDSVKVDFADGTVFNLTADSLISLAKKVRSDYASLRISVDSWMPIHVNDKNEDYVLVWETDNWVDSKGKADSVRTHSYWQIKNNKISHWSEFNQKLTPPPPPMENSKSKK
jgi:hypothetical protein